MINSASNCSDSNTIDSIFSIDKGNKLSMIRNNTSCTSYEKHDSVEMMKIQQVILDVDSHTLIDNSTYSYSSNPLSSKSIFVSDGVYDDVATLKVGNLLPFKKEKKILILYNSVSSFYNI